MPGLVDITRLGADVAEAKVLCVFVHGRNQSPEEMEVAVTRHLTTSGVHLALPRAGDKCWYNALAVDPRSDTTQTELAKSLADLAGLVASLRRDAPDLPLVLAGFSQGACLSLEYGFTGQGAPDAIVAFTGCRVGVAGDARANAFPAGLPVYLTAGSDDPWIPLHAFAAAAQEVGRAGAILRADVFPDRPHEVSNAEIAMLDAILGDIAAGRAPTMGAAR